MFTSCALLLIVLLAGQTYGSPVETACPGPDPYDYYSADSDNCAIFYICDHGAWVKKDCPAGLHFHQGLHICDYPANANCNVCPVTCNSETGTCDAANAQCICEPGYTGSACDQDLDECEEEVDTCTQNCLNTKGSFTCSCNAGYIQDGVNCTDINECALGIHNCSSLCLNTNGSYTCDCMTGYTLAPDGCTCEKFTPKCEPACQNNGTCVQGPNGTALCLCTYGFKGVNCEEIDLCAPIICMNNGTCEIVGDQGFCRCLPAYTGPLCDKEISGSCSESGLVCQNGGQCSDASGNAQCYCPLGYTGVYCEQTIPKTSPTCSGLVCYNGGQCSNVAGTDQCMCLNGFTGAQCQTPVTSHNACQTSGLLCQNSGICTEMSGTAICLCQPGYSGPTCSNKDELCDSVICLNGGACQQATTGELSCVCTDQFAGQFCEIRVDCSSVVCLNGGICALDGKTVGCSCLSGTSGQHCESRDDCSADGSPCLNGGRCIDSSSGFVCVCTFGWTGFTCETTRTCADGFITCENGGTCSDTDDGATCLCAAGYLGNNCELKDDGCGGCENGGICKVPEILPMESGNKSCACLAGFTGDRCQTAADCTIPCSPEVGAGGQRHEVLIFADLSSPTHVYICREGYLQRFESCPNTRYNPYTTGCLTDQQYAAALQGTSDLWYPPS